MRIPIILATLIALSSAMTPVASAETTGGNALPTPLQQAVEEFKTVGKSPSAGPIFVSWGEFVTGAGETFVPVMLYFPKGSVPVDGGEPVTFFGVVQDGSGENVTAFQNSETILTSKDDLYVEETLTLPGGEHRGFFGIARDGEVLGIVSAEMKLEGELDKDSAAFSPLILSNNLFPLDRPQAPTDPFAFGGVKVVPKGDRAFRSSDELWYFFEMRNPGLVEPPLPADGTVLLSPVVPAPRVQVKLDLEGEDSNGKPVKMAAPPREVEAMEMRGVAGHYGVGSAIPLASFKPGEYKLTVKVIDTVRKASQTMTETFRVIE